MTGAIATTTATTTVRGEAPHWLLHAANIAVAACAWLIPTAGAQPA